MKLNPRFHQPQLASREVSGDHLNRVDSEDAHAVLIIGVEVRLMVTTANLNEHADDDSIKSTELRHLTLTVNVPPSGKVKQAAGGGPDPAVRARRLT